MIYKGKIKCCQLIFYFPLVKIGTITTFVITLIGPIKINNIYKAIKEYHFPQGKHLAKFIIG
jgi:hypothetical protein